MLYEVITLVSGIRSHEAELLALRESAKAESDKKKRKELEKQADEVRDELFDRMRRLRLKDHQVDKIVDRLV